MQANPTVKRSGIDPTRDTEPWYKYRWTWFIMLGPAIVVVAGLTTAYIAVKQQDTLVVDDYYTQGNAINQDLRRDRAATKLALGMDMTYNPAAAKLQGTLFGAGKPLANNPVMIHFMHPTLPEKDLSFTTRTDASGQFSINLADLEMARWQVAVTGSEGDWRMAADWRWPAEKSVEVRADLPTAP